MIESLEGVVDSIGLTTSGLGLISGCDSSDTTLELSMGVSNFADEMDVG